MSFTTPRPSARFPAVARVCSAGGPTGLAVLLESIASEQPKGDVA